ncbi:MAG TPA: Gfo/Idh/MocA family oxidoreductase [Vicinamibacterales bacterium]|jgi:predicted dehydrogenase|nr:Gfo/Idh/MocA family oxidoreductase [Vicinamibacterales bacterium]
MRELQQAWPRPAHPRPIIVIGAGAIVRTAHLPAYHRLGFPVAGVFDIDADQARATAQQFGVPRVHASLDDAAVSGAVFDVAVPGDQVVGILEQLPDGAPVLIQKPMGADLKEADRILACCRGKHLIAAMNFQLRFAPGMLALHDLVCHHDLGRIVDVDVRVVIEQPWQNWTFMVGAPRIEIVYHSIHYIDAIRWLIGEPAGVYCKAVGHPSTPQLSDTRSTIILDYGNSLRCSLVLNHTHMADATQKTSQIMVEGINGIARATWGVNLDYPAGPADTLEVYDVSAKATGQGPGWTPMPLRGSWFTEAFEGPMSNLQRFIAGEDAALVSPVEDSIRTMAVVEACYQSSTRGGTPIPTRGSRE